LDVLFQFNIGSSIIPMSEKKSGIREIAKLAGVSMATVSRVLNGNKSVNPELAARVLELSNSLGYQPSPAARYMRSKKSDLLGIVVPDLSLNYFSSMVNGAIDKAREYGQLVIVGTVEGDVELEREYLKKFSSYMLDGLIHCPVSEAPLEDEPSVLSIPLVVAGRRHVIEGVPHIYTDEEKAAYLAAKYLLSLGRRKIGFLAGFWGSPPFENYQEMISAVDTPLSGSYSALERLRGFRKALVEFNQDLDESRLIFCGFERESGYKASRELFERLIEFDALIVPNCIVANGAFQFFQEQEICIPQDVSVVALDDMGMGELLTIPITSISHDMYRVGVEAVVQLNKIIGELDAENRTIDVKLQIRRSTARKS
jgi:LacI family transcriptional regulator, galactose operon repressor